MNQSFQQMALEQLDIHIQKMDLFADISPLIKTN